MIKVINMTQHNGTEAQHRAGLVEWADAHLSHSQFLAATDGDPADFETLVPDDLRPSLTISPEGDTPIALADRAQALATWADTIGVRAVMIGGHFGLTVDLSEALTRRGILPVRAVTERKSVEKTDSTGKVIKTSSFEHLGFVPMLPSWWQDSAKIAPEAYQAVRNAVTELVKAGATTPAFSEYWKRVFGL